MPTAASMISPSCAALGTVRSGFSGVGLVVPRKGLIAMSPPRTTYVIAEEIAARIWATVRGARPARIASSTTAWTRAERGATTRAGAVVLVAVPDAHAPTPGRAPRRELHARIHDVDPSLPAAPDVTSHGVSSWSLESSGYSPARPGFAGPRNPRSRARITSRLAYERWMRKASATACVGAPDAAGRPRPPAAGRRRRSSPWAASPWW